MLHVKKKFFHENCSYSAQSQINEQKENFLLHVVPLLILRAFVSYNFSDILLYLGNEDETVIYSLYIVDHKCPPEHAVIVMSSSSGTSCIGL